MNQHDFDKTGIYINLQPDLSDLNKQMKSMYHSEYQTKMSQKMEVEYNTQSQMAMSSMLLNPTFWSNPAKGIKQYQKKMRKTFSNNGLASGLRYTLDKKQDGTCKHLLIKHTYPTLKFSKIHLAFADTLKEHPKSINYHLFIRGWAPHICLNCSLNLLIVSNNLESILKWLIKYKKYYYQKIKQRPLKVTNDLINIMEISVITLQALSHVKIVKFFMANKNQFKRMFTLLHILADFWIELSMVDKSAYELQYAEESQFNVRFEQFIECDEFFLEMYYSSFLQKVKLFKMDHVKWYLELGKKGEYFMKYGVNGCKGTATQHEYKYNMYSVFGKLLERKCCKFPRLICRNLEINLKSMEYIKISLHNEMRWGVVEPRMVIQRMNQCFYVHYSTWSCNNFKCNISYFEHVYKYKYEQLLDKRNRYGVVDRKYKTNNKWYLCKGCRLVSYCSGKCQKFDWNKSHRETCSKICYG
eukprot:287731_1